MIDWKDRTTITLAAGLLLAATAGASGALIVEHELRHDGPRLVERVVIHERVTRDDSRTIHRTRPATNRDSAPDSSGWSVHGAFDERVPRLRAMPGDVSSLLGAPVRPRARRAAVVDEATQREIYRAELVRHRAEIEQCLDFMDRNGLFFVEFWVEPDGDAYGMRPSPRSARLLDETLDLEESIGVRRCLAMQAPRLQFPAFERHDVLRIEYPFSPGHER
jgi:hypothetical protein